MWDLIVSVPDHCLSFYLKNLEFFTQRNIHNYLKYLLNLFPSVSYYLPALISQLNSCNNLRGERV